MSLATATVSILLTLIYYISNRFTGSGITEAVLFHALTLFSGINLLQFPFETGLVLSSLILIGVFIIFNKSKFKSQSSSQPKHLLELSIFSFFACFSVVVHPATQQIEELTSLILFNKNIISLSSEMKNPKTITPAVSKPKSLLYIYAESLERTFFDDLIFPGLITNLKEFEKKSLTFHGLKQAPMTEWTIAGMVASQCGIPLATFRANRNDLSDRLSFIPGATCLGDILNNTGYQTVYMGGADLDFAGKSRFYETHQFDEIIGVREIQEKFSSELPVSKWGIYDDVLFDTALEKFAELAAKDDPFALVLLTLDTHPPSGHVTPRCSNVKYRDGSVPMLNAIKCTDQLISNFLSAVQSTVHNHDLVIVVASDHQMMSNDVSETLEVRSDKRENLLILNSDSIAPGVVEREGTTLDIAPTLLTALGWDTEQLALGRSLFAPNQTLVEKYGAEELFPMIQSWRLSLLKTWVD